MAQNGIKSEAGASDDAEKGRKLFIGGITYNTTDEMLREFFEQWGELTDCIVMRDSATKRSRGFGFVTYADMDQLEAAMTARPHKIDGKVVESKRAIPRDMSQRSEANMTVKKLYVSGVRENHTEEEFREYFGKYGGVESVEIITDKQTGQPRGFAFVTFDDYDAVDRCVLERSHYIKGMRCDVKKALGKEEIKKSQQKERERAERDMRSRGTGRMGGGGSGGQWGGSSGYGGYGGSGGGYAGGWSQGAWGQGGGQGWSQGAGGWDQSAGYGAGGYGGGYDQAAWGQQQAAWGSQDASGQQGWGQQQSWGQPPQGWQQQPTGGWGQQQQQQQQAPMGQNRGY